MTIHIKFLDVVRKKIITDETIEVHAVHSIKIWKYQDRASQIN